MAVTFTAVFAALYAVGVVVLAPISFQVFQVRVADALLPLSMLFGWPAILGLALGAFVANLFGGLGPVDMIGGALANLLAGYVARRITLNRGRRWVPLAVCLQVVVVTVIVGTYLSYLFGIPLQIAWIGVMLGSIVAIGFLGSLLLFALSSKRIVNMLSRLGVAVHRQETKWRAGNAQRLSRGTS
jgi:uncharacterized membrane protein